MIFAGDCSRHQLRTYQSRDWPRTVLDRAAQPTRVTRWMQTASDWATRSTFTIATTVGQ